MNIQETNNPRWYILYTLPRMEKKLESYLTQYKVPNYLPKLKVKSRWKDRWKIIEKPLFPSYIFVQIDYWKERKKILNLPGVHHFIFWNGNPAEVREEDLDLVQTFIQEYPEKIKLKKNKILRPGNIVEVTQGTFAGKKCEILKIDKKQCKIIVRFPALNQAIQVQLTLEELGIDELGMLMK